jgi:hypothetical protein
MKHQIFALVPAWPGMPGCAGAISRLFGFSGRGARRATDSERGSQTAKRAGPRSRPSDATRSYFSPATQAARLYRRFVGACRVGRVQARKSDPSALPVSMIAIPPSPTMVAVWGDGTPHFYDTHGHFCHRRRPVTKVANRSSSIGELHGSAMGSTLTALFPVPYKPTAECDSTSDKIPDGTRAPGL